MICGRRHVLTASLAALFLRPKDVSASSREIKMTSAGDLTTEARDRHEHYMQMAIDALGGGAPFGAVIVDEESGEVMCQGVNRGRVNRIYHGEMDAMINCSNQHPDIDWSKLALYTTGEPCPMCMSAIVWNRIPKVVYATSIRKLKNIGLNQIGLESPTVAGAAPFYSGEIISGVLEDRTNLMFEKWWAARQARFQSEQKTAN